MSGESDALNRRVGRLLRATRARRRMSQERLAERVGTSQQWLSRVERGMVNLKLGDAERLFGLLGLRLTVQTAPPVDPRTADPDLVPADAVDQELAASVAEFHIVWRRFAEVGYVVGGRLAALAQGLPVRPQRLDLIITDGDVAAAEEAVQRLNAAQWSERHQDFSGFARGVSGPGARRWLVAGLFELRIDLVAEPVPSAQVAVNDRSLPVALLTDLVRQDPDIADLSRRVGGLLTLRAGRQAGRAGGVGGSEAPDPQRLGYRPRLEWAPGGHMRGVTVGGFGD